MLLEISVRLKQCLKCLKNKIIQRFRIFEEQITLQHTSFFSTFNSGRKLEAVIWSHIPSTACIQEETLLASIVPNSLLCSDQVQQSFFAYRCWLDSTIRRVALCLGQVKKNPFDHHQTSHSLQYIRAQLKRYLLPRIISARVKTAFAPTWRSALLLSHIESFQSN